MPCLPQLHLGGIEDLSKSEAGEVVAGFLEVSCLPSSSHKISSTQSPCKKTPSNASQKVFVRIYQTSSERFAVLYPVKALVCACKPLTSVNLRSCVLEHMSPDEFKVVPTSYEGVALTFRVVNSSGPSLDAWVDAFTGEPAVRRSSDPKKLLPVVVERDEEEEHSI